MNYLAHGYRHTERPYFLAGTAVPDWLHVCEGRIRFRDPRGSGLEDTEIGQGIRQHIEDDRRFHAHEVFLEVSGAITARIREAFPDNPRLRAHFLGHILTELLLDSALMEQDPGRVLRYYSALGQVDAERIEEVVEAISGERPRGLAVTIEKFRRERFLLCYRQDHRLQLRLSQVLRRIGLPPLPPGFETLLPGARILVRENAHALMS